MSEILLDPGNDQDYLNILCYKTPVVLKKKGVRPGQDSPLKAGDTREGIIKKFKIGEPLEIEGAKSGATTNIEQIGINDTLGQIQLKTRTSIYSVELADKSKEPHRMSLQFLRRGYLDFDDKMPDGFFDGGRNMKFLLKDGQLKPKPASREIIVSDSEHDPKLKRTLETAKSLLDSVRDLEAKIKILALYVSNIMGGSQIGKQPHEMDILELSNKNIAHIFSQWKTHENAIPIGYLTHGVCRHRANLFKYLADRLGIPCRLVRGAVGNPGNQGAHQWNVVKLHNKLFVVDVMQDPTNLYEEDSDIAKLYTRRNIKGNRGGVGGRSVGKIG